MLFPRRLFSREFARKLLSLTLAASLLPGCSTADKNLTYIGDSDLQYYDDRDVEIAQPDYDQCTSDPVSRSRSPRTLVDRSHDEIWDLSLAEALHLALINNRIIRVRGDFRTGAAQLYSNANGVPSVYDVGITDSGVLFGVRGVEAALSAFDTQFTTQMVWGHNSQFINNVFTAGGLAEGSILNQDTGQFQAQLQKTLAYGGQISVGQNWNYLWNDQPAQLFHSVYTGSAVLNYTQPLWAGAGAEFTRIAGPVNTGIQGFAAVTGVSQGVMIARINTDIAVTDFEIQVRNMLKDVEDVYWDLHLAYRTYDTAVEARNSFLESWRFTEINAREGIGKLSQLEEAQSREAYFSARTAVEDALQNLYALETQLRRLLGLPSSDGRIIRPADDPTTGQFVPDWNVCLAEGLTRREELRKQKWNVKSLELQLRAAENLANPSLNFVSSYQLNGFGNDLFGENLPPGNPGHNLQSAYRTLMQANQTGWTLGFQFSMPLGLRFALSQVRNYELRVAKAREVLGLQELEVAHELTTTFQNLAWRYQTAQTNFNAWQAAEQQVPGRENRYKTGVPNIDTSVLLDQWLQARRRAAQAEVTFYTSVIEYNKAITDLHYRKGTLLDVNNVHLQEGAWTPDAYKDALRRAWARTFAFDALDIDPLTTQPETVERAGYGTVQFIGPSSVPPEPVAPPGLRSKTDSLPAPDQAPPPPRFEPQSQPADPPQLPYNLGDE
ncbi:MAG: TolC family protein [Planctomycetaceae bacterium]